VSSVVSGLQDVQYVQVRHIVARKQRSAVAPDLHILQT
jgi:hypothetical protein